MAKRKPPKPVQSHRKSKDKTREWSTSDKKPRMLLEPGDEKSSVLSSSAQRATGNVPTSAQRKRANQSQGQQQRKDGVRKWSASEKKRRTRPYSPEDEPSTAPSAAQRAANPSTSTRDPIIPFDVFDSILLVGEGDLSFTRSLIDHHGCASVMATVLDDEDVLLAKYPHAAATNMAAINGEAPDSILYGVDATQLAREKRVRSRGPFDRIFFNFPHTGGLSKDVNRQVRANQALLAAFFGSAEPLLRKPHGSILVTLFEAEPYSLWNVRDLGRSRGLVVKRSWAFDPSVYPGYAHARTIGEVKSRDGSVSTTAWKGAEREARVYEFGLKGEQDGEETVGKKRKRRPRDESSEDED